MSQAVELNFKSASVPQKRKHSKKLSVYLVVLGLIPAALLYWHYLDQLTHVRVPVKSSQKPGPKATIGQPKPVASSPKPDEKPATAKTEVAGSANEAPVGFVDSLMSLITPSAQAVTMQPEMSPALKVMTPDAAPAVTPVTLARKILPLTAAQQRLKVAQHGFDDFMNLASSYPSSYGFQTGEELRYATLGEPIQVYLLVPTGRNRATDQSINSLLQPTEQWFYPVMLGNHIRFMVQVRSDGHDYVLGNGTRALAMDYDKIVARWPASEGFHPQLIIHPNRPFYYFTIPELPDQNLTDTSRMQDFNPSPTPAKVLLASWQ